MMILSFRDRVEKYFYSVIRPPTSSTGTISLLSNIEMYKIFIFRHYLHILIRYQKMHSDCTVVQGSFFTSSTDTFRSAEGFFRYHAIFFQGI